MKERAKAKSIALLTAFLMVFAMTPLVAFGEEASISGLWVGGSDEITAVGPVSGTNATSGTATVSIETDSETNNETLVLTLDGFTYTGEGHHNQDHSAYDTNTTASICYTGDRPLRIVLVGENTVAQSNHTSDGDKRSSSGIYTNKPLTIIGGGSLDVSGGNCNMYSIGVNSRSDVTIKDTTVNTSGGDAVHSEGIYCAQNIAIDGSKVTATTGEANGNNDGISANRTITIDDSEVSAAGKIYGIYAFGGLAINSGSVTASGTGLSSYGIFVGSDAMVTIGEAVTKVEASGSSQAISGKVKNAVPGKGWKNVEGTAGEGEIQVYSGTGNGYDFSNEDPYHFYKKVLFETTGYGLWVGGSFEVKKPGEVSRTKATSGTATVSIETDSETNNETLVLTLDGFTYTGEGHFHNGSGYLGKTTASICYTGDRPLRIVLVGKNTLAQSNHTSDGDERSSSGIYTNKPLIITGGGSLDVSGGSCNMYSVGINCSSDVTIKDTTVNASVGDAVHSEGIYCSQSIAIDGSKVTATTGESNGRNEGITAGRTITIDDSEVSATGEDYGICAERGLAINSGSVTASGEYGIYVGDDDDVMVTIGEDVSKVEASGSSQAIGGNLKNAVPGKAWNNVEGTGDAESIEVYSGTGNGYDFYEQPFRYYQKVLFKGVHQHKFTYETGTGGKTITAKCTGKLDCPEGYKTNGITITLNAPSDLTYDGKEKAASISGYPKTAVENLADMPKIDYYKSAGAGSTSVSGNKLSGAPKDAGNYVAKITWGGAAASVPFTITKASAQAPTKVSGMLMAKMTGGKNSATVTWNKISGAAGYDVFFAKCTKKKDKGDGKLIGTVSAGQTLKFTQTGLKKKAAYKAYVRAFVMKDGKKQYMKTSPEVHAATSGGKYTNPKSVAVKKTKVTLKKGKTAKIKAKVKKLKAGKKLLPRYHDAKVRYLSSDPKIATVSAKGKIKAKAKGTCKIYVYAVNGAYKTVKVTVK